MCTHVYTRTTEVGTFSWLASKQKIIALYALLQFFVVDKNDVINCTALSNNQLRISGTNTNDQLGLFYETYHFEATDRS